ncbi:MAG: heme exporter protein CcmB [Deltaproteobacteria bacterium]|nr:heme exporter protein CcmB [Deltaproteobacteria bacterium]MBI3078832.1 heme exporter protein CcmB [Deltaproteobacteria bacterium]
MSFLRRVYIIAWKDVLLDLHTRENVTTLVFFSALILLVFNFALGPDRELLAQVSAGVIWLAFLLAGMLALGRSFLLERENECLEGLLLIPVDRSAIYLGKLGGNLLFMLVAEAILLPLFAVFFNLDLWAALPRLIPVAVLGTLGFAGLGTLFSAMAVHVRAREVMLPLLLLPVAVPVILATIRSTEVILRAGPWAEVAPWLQLMAGFDVIFLTVGVLVFDFILEQ